MYECWAHKVDLSKIESIVEDWDCRRRPSKVKLWVGYKYNRKELIGDCKEGNPMGIN